jgi:hypothetical protein
MKKNFIEIYDDIIPLTLQDYVEFLVIKNGINVIPFNFVKGMTDHKEESNSDYGWIHKLLLCENGDKFFSDYMATIHQILYYFTMYKKLNIKQILASRIFLQTPSLNPGVQKPHIDTTNSHLACLYYINDSDGDTVFYNKDKEIKRVSPKKGRIVFFDGLIKHSGSRPKDNHRAIINFNFTVL